jgi:hypothetical protein
MMLNDTGFETLERFHNTRELAKILLARIFSYGMESIEIQDAANDIFKLMPLPERQLFNKMVMDEVFKTLAKYCSIFFMSYREREDTFGHEGRDNRFFKT